MDSLVLTATGRIVVAGIGATILIKNRQTSYLIYGDGKAKDIGQNKTSFLRLQDEGVSAEGTATSRGDHRRQDAPFGNGTAARLEPKQFESHVQEPDCFSTLKPISGSPPL
jgi:hypothetical protein